MRSGRTFSPPLAGRSRERFEAYRDDFEARRGNGRASSAHGHHGSARRRHERQRSFWQLFRAFLGQLSGHHGILAAALTVSAVATLLGLIPLYGTKLIFDNVLGGQPLAFSVPDWVWFPVDWSPSRRTLLFTVTGAMAGFALLTLTLSIWSRWQATRITKRVQMAVRRRVFDRAVRLPLYRVYQIKSGGAASILREDAGSVGDLVFAMLYNPSKAIIQLIGSLIILAFVDGWLLLGSLVLLPIVYLSHKAYISRIRPLFRDIRASRQAIDGHVTESFGGIRVVRGFGRQRSEARRFITNNHFMARQELMVWWWNRSIDIAWSIVIPVASAALLLYGGLQILNDQAAVEAGTLAANKAFTVGDLVMFLAYLGWLLNPLAMLANSATGFQNGLAGLDRVLDLLEEAEELPSRPGAARLRPEEVAGRLSIEEVWFRYPTSDPDSPPVLQDINMEIQPGEMVALIGPSGAGKTTLTNLIARFYDPTRGRICLDGLDLRDITLPSYRRLLGIVEQDIFLFDGTIGQNIVYGGRGVTRDQLVAAAKQANAHDFIMQFSDGYDTLIGERGVKLSGGQRQRLAIARAILADPRLLILDEATSNLDTESERLIQSSLESLMQGRTSIVIAHRLSTITHADRIVVLDGGRILAQGDHEQLLETCPRYQHMLALQTEPAHRRNGVPAGE